MGVRDEGGEKMGIFLVNPNILINFAGMNAAKKNMNAGECRSFLVEKLRQEGALWSYDPDSVQADEIDDEVLVELVLRYLDIDEIKILFALFSYNKVKAAWLKRMVPQGEYLYSLNRFIAWYYFRVKRPDAYVKAMATRYYNKIA